MEQSEDGQQRTRKIRTVVTTGNREGDSIILSLCDKRYSLQSVLFHQGKTLFIEEIIQLNFYSLQGAGVHSGHYTAVIKQKDSWWFMNDQVVTKSDSTTNNMMNKAWKSSENYMAIYKKER